MKPIPGRMSLLSSESSGFAQMGMLAIPQGQILRSDFGRSSCSSKIGGMSGSGSSVPGIFGGCCSSLGGVPVCLCESPGCCPPFWGVLGGVMIYQQARLLVESRGNCQINGPILLLFFFFFFRGRYLPYLEITRAECPIVTLRSPFSTSFRPRGAVLIPTR